MAKSLGITFLVGLLVLSFGCASIFSGTKQNVSFESTPPGAKVNVKNKKNGVESTGTTPCDLKLKRNGRYIGTVEMVGYETENLRFDKEFNMVSLINLIWLIGFAIDAGTGAIYKIDPSDYSVTLKKIEPVKAPPAPSIPPPQN